MRRKKVDLQIRGNCMVFDDGILKISKEDNKYYFEIGSEITCDVSEAVAMMMSRIDWNSEIWSLDITDFDMSLVVPERTLFWLSGGNTEWRSLDNYNRPWCDCYLDFQEEFGVLVYNIVEKSKKMVDIRNSFVRYLNLPLLYDFALSKDFVR